MPRRRAAEQMRPTQPRQASSPVPLTMLSPKTDAYRHVSRLRGGRRKLGKAGHVGSVVEPRHFMRTPDREFGLLAGVVVEGRNPKHDVRLRGTLGNQMRAAYRAEMAEFPR